MSKLREIREREGVRQTELNRQCGVSVATIRRAEKGRYPAPVTQAKIVRGVNKLAGSDYSVTDVFPPKK